MSAANKSDLEFSELEHGHKVQTIPDAVRVEGGYHVEVEGENTTNLKLAKNGHVSTSLPSLVLTGFFSLHYGRC